MTFYANQIIQQRKLKSQFQKENDLNYDSTLQDSDINTHILPDS